MNTLVALAARAEGQPSPPGFGPYSCIHTRGWYTAMAQMTDGRILHARVEETEREFWVAADGSGRIEETRDGRRSRPSGLNGPGACRPDRGRRRRPESLATSPRVRTGRHRPSARSGT